MSGSFSARAQTSLKWNVMYWMLGITNMSVETRVANRFTFNGEIYAPRNGSGELLIYKLGAAVSCKLSTNGTKRVVA